MSERINVEHAFDPEARQAQAEMDLYIENRPSQDQNGNVHGPDGKFINTDAYFDEQRQIAEEENNVAYEDMSMSQLARKLAEAEFHDDKTTQQNINDVLLDKMIAEEEKLDSSPHLERAMKDAKKQNRELTDEEKDAATMLDNENSSLISDNIQDRVLKIKDKELERLQGANPDNTSNVEPNEEDLGGEGEPNQPPEGAPAPEDTPENDPQDEAEDISDNETEVLDPINPDDLVEQAGTDLVIREKGWRGRLSRLWNKARYEITTMMLNPKEYFTDTEQGKKRKIIAAVAGAGAVGLALYATQKTGDNSALEHVNQGTLDASPQTGEDWGLYNQSPGLELTDGAPAPADAQPVPEMQSELVKVPTQETVSATMTLDPGENIWNKSAEYLQANGIPATDANIDTVKDAVLKHQGISELEATRLPVGYEFTIPQEVIEELSKGKA